MVGIGEQVTAHARDWIGTPYRHQASTKGAGADCLGLLRGIWRELYGAEPEAMPAYTPDWSEPQREERLWKAALRHLQRQQRPTIGGVMLFRMRAGGVAKHLGIVGQVGPEPTFIHSYTGHGVIESPFSTPWQRRVVAHFSFPEEDS